jgi:hypothetical protein
MSILFTGKQNLPLIHTVPMTKIIYPYLVCLLFAGPVFFSCRKAVMPVNSGTIPATPTQTDTAKIIQPVPYPQTNLSRCPGAPDYGDTIIYLQPSGQDYIVAPLNRPDSGKYFAWPQGMDINTNTGAINVSKSSTGLRYNIGYVKNGTTDTCLQKLIIAGASYADSVYVLANNETLAKPYFNANPYLASICNGGGSPGVPSCAFDITGQLNRQRIAVDKNTGVIDLKKSLYQGVFGLIPLDGTTVNTTMYYQLNDNSNMAVQAIPIQLVFYNRKSNVPPSLLSDIGYKLNQILNNLLLINTTGRASGNPRPPIIIVTRFQ